MTKGVDVPEVRPIEVRALSGSAVRRGRMRWWTSRPGSGLRGSTAVLVMIWIAAFALYLAVRPGG
ncbi:hypothetical protein [Nocardia vermiculata]|uniref:Uncharacterized protein n=1 Tax=Nocardia vermiculata TaxID=257274 RepID=A0A846Y2E5_9NOCA|nr:hypothetical protein [Nocardia vermiculata]NKY51881.1 hypothetical protein [Nocardia vermiculata]